MSDKQSIQYLYLRYMREEHGLNLGEDPFSNLDTDIPRFLASMSVTIRNKFIALKATVRNETSGSFNLHNIPAEIRLAIFKLLFKDALMTFLPRGRRNPELPVVQGQSDVFRQDNMSPSILLVCKEFYREGLKELFRNLTVEENGGATNFHEILSFRTQNELRSFRNMSPHIAVNMFPKLRVWFGVQKFRINHGLPAEMADKTPEVLYADVVKGLSVAYRPSDELIASVNNRKCRRVQFYGEYELLDCESIGELGAKGSKLLHPERLMDACHHIHVFVGHLYVDYLKERAFFDAEDKMGRESSIRALLQE